MTPATVNEVKFAVSLHQADRLNGHRALFALAMPLVGKSSRGVAAGFGLAVTTAAGAFSIFRLF